MVGVRQGRTLAGLDVCKVKASGLELTRSGSKSMNMSPLREAGCTAKHEDSSLPAASVEAAIKKHTPFLAGELPEGDCYGSWWVGEAVFPSVGERGLPPN